MDLFKGYIVKFRLIGLFSVSGEYVGGKFSTIFFNRRMLLLMKVRTTFETLCKQTATTIIS